jgi:hypothetical protein
MNDRPEAVRETSELEAIAGTIIEYSHRISKVRERVFTVTGEVGGELGVRDDRVEAPMATGKIAAVKESLRIMGEDMHELEGAAAALEALNL